MENKNQIEHLFRKLSVDYPNRSNDEMLIDVLTDLMHVANYYRVNFAYALRLANSHFAVETSGQQF